MCWKIILQANIVVAIPVVENIFASDPDHCHRVHRDQKFIPANICHQRSRASRNLPTERLYIARGRKHLRMAEDRSHKYICETEGVPLGTSSKKDGRGTSRGSGRRSAPTTSQRNLGGHPQDRDLEESTPTFTKYVFTIIIELLSRGHLCKTLPQDFSKRRFGQKMVKTGWRPQIMILRKTVTFSTYPFFQKVA